MNKMSSRDTVYIINSTREIKLNQDQHLVDYYSYCMANNFLHCLQKK